jgi:hypothetical protein
MGNAIAHALPPARRNRVGLQHQGTNTTARMKKLLLGILLAGIAGVLGYRYLAPLLDPDRPRYTVQDTGLRSLEGTFGSTRMADGAGMYWMDNLRLLAVADALAPDAAAAVYKEPAGKALYIWDAAAASYRKYRDLPLHDFSNLCYYQGTVWYRNGISPTRDSILYWSGRLGSEQWIRMPLLGAKADYLSGDRMLNPFSCAVVSRRDALRREHQEPASKAKVILLRPEDGYIFLFDPLDYYHQSESENALLYRADGSPPVTLSLRADMLETAGIGWSEYAGAYVITPAAPVANHRAANAPPAQAPRIAYQLAPNGKLTTLTFPGELPIASNAVFPTAQGLFLPDGFIQDPKRDAGGWLVRNGKTYKLYDALSASAAVSADGCKLAVDLTDDPKHPIGMIRIYDFCPPEK